MAGDMESPERAAWKVRWQNADTAALLEGRGCDREEERRALDELERLREDLASISACLKALWEHAEERVDWHDGDEAAARAAEDAPGLIARSQALGYAPPGAHETGIGWIGMAQGEIELRLQVDGVEGSCFLSKEMWEAFGEKAGWSPPGG